jgi:hypothetical protein
VDLPALEIPSRKRFSYDVVVSSSRQNQEAFDSVAPDRGMGPVGSRVRVACCRPASDEHQPRAQDHRESYLWPVGQPCSRRNCGSRSAVARTTSTGLACVLDTVPPSGHDDRVSMGVPDA